MENEIVILANGDFPSHPLPLEILRSGRRIICCDGAVDALVRLGLEPVTIVGDMDSIDSNLAERYRERIFHIGSQETNDLTKAFNHAVNLQPEKIFILGASGKREDHTLGNISLLSLYGKHKEIKVEMVTDSGTLIPVYSTTTFKAAAGSPVSVFSLDHKLRMTSEGLMYPIKGVKFDSWWKATLNISVSEQFTLKFRKGRVIVFIGHK